MLTERRPAPLSEVRLDRLSQLVEEHLREYVVRLDPKVKNGRKILPLSYALHFIGLKWTWPWLAPLSDSHLPPSVFHEPLACRVVISDREFKKTEQSRRLNQSASTSSSLSARKANLLLDRKSHQRFSGVHKFAQDSEASSQVSPLRSARTN